MAPQLHTQLVIWYASLASRSLVTFAFPLALLYSKYILCYRLILRITFILQECECRSESSTIWHFQLLNIDPCLIILKAHTRFEHYLHQYGDGFRYYSSLEGATSVLSVLIVLINNSICICSSAYIQRELGIPEDSLLFSTNFV